MITSYSDTSDSAEEYVPEEDADNESSDGDSVPYKTEQRAPKLRSSAGSFAGCKEKSLSNLKTADGTKASSDGDATQLGTPNIRIKAQDNQVTLHRPPHAFMPMDNSAKPDLFNRAKDHSNLFISSSDSLSSQRSTQDLPPLDQRLRRRRFGQLDSSPTPPNKRPRVDDAGEEQQSETQNKDSLMHDANSAPPSHENEDLPHDPAHTTRAAALKALLLQHDPPLADFHPPPAPPTPSPTSTPTRSSTVLPFPDPLNALALNLRENNRTPWSAVAAALTARRTARGHSALPPATPSESYSRYIQARGARLVAARALAADQPDRPLPRGRGHLNIVEPLPEGSSPAWAVEGFAAGGRRRRTTTGAPAGPGGGLGSGQGAGKDLFSPARDEMLVRAVERSWRGFWEGVADGVWAESGVRFAAGACRERWGEI